MIRLLELLFELAIAALVIGAGIFLIRSGWINSDLIFPLIVVGFFFSMRPMLTR